MDYSSWIALAAAALGAYNSYGGGGANTSASASPTTTGTPKTTSGGTDWWGIGSSVISAAPAILGALDSSEKREYTEEQNAIANELARDKFEWEKQNTLDARADASGKFAQKMQAEAFQRMLGTQGLASTNSRVVGAKRVDALQQLAALGAAAAAKGGRG